jgi:hypothetical protein
MTDQSSVLSLSAIKDRQQKTWTSGDYARIGNTLVIMGELLCEAVDPRAGDKVLDGPRRALSATCSALWASTYLRPPG